MTDKDTLEYARLFFGSRIARIAQLMNNVAEAPYQTLPAEEPNLIEPYCDDYYGCDTINMCFDKGLLDQIGSDDSYRIVMTDEGRKFMESLK